MDYYLRYMEIKQETMLYYRRKKEVKRAIEAIETIEEINVIDVAEVT